jgi:hypothetical protein
MPVLADSQVASATRRPVNANGVPIHTTTFVGTNWTMRGPDSPPPPPAGSFYPMAFLVEQPPGSVVQGHYHQADQFQVVVAGGGKLGKHGVAPITVHYTNAHTPYGPIAAGEEGLSYFTLRNGYDPGAQYMPAAAKALKAVAARDPWQVTTERAQPLPRNAATTEELLPARADGLGAWRHVLPAGAAFTGPAPGEGMGQFWLVVAGEFAGLPPLSLVFVAPEEAAYAGRAGAEGAEVLVLQYPRRPAH